MASDDTERLPYLFNRDFRSSIRLNNNHWMMKEIAGYLIHPTIPLENPDCRIADIGTGTTIWALEVAALLPDTVRIDGFDISPSQFVPTSAKPSNLHLHLHDCFKPFPTEFIGKFDVVHARFWLCLVNGPDAPDLLRNFVSLLKPGGYLQWFEPLPLSVKAVHPNPESRDSAVDRMAAQWHKPTHTSSYEWVEKLPEAYREQGLNVVAVDRLSIPKRYRYFWCQSQLAGLEDKAADVKMVGVENSEALKQWIVQLSEGFANGSYIDTPFICAVGKKG